MPEHFRYLPIDHPRPDVTRFIEVIMGHRTSAKPPLVEYLVDNALRKPITTGLLGRRWVEAGDAVGSGLPGGPVSVAGEQREAMAAYLDNFIAFWYRLGYDFVRYEEALPFREHNILGHDPSGLDGRRQWRDMCHGAIATWEDFERYPWPTVTPETFANYEYLATHLPEGMGLLVCHAGGIYEHLSAIMSYEGLCYALYDAPDLVAAVAQRLGTLLLDVYRQLVELPNVAAIFPGDDMGFRSATLIPPAALRQYTLPWHRRYAALAHEQGLPYFLHSCGNLAEIMDDLIEDVGIDAKHSYENAILPADEFQARYGQRIGVLGGVDIDILGRQPPEAVRAEVRRLIEACHPRGRFCIGSGNSIPSYIPLDNYMSMIDEAQR